MGEASPQGQRIQGTAGPASVFGAGGGGPTWVADRLGWEWPPVLIYFVLGISIILLIWGTSLFAIRAYRWFQAQRGAPSTLIGKAVNKMESSHLIWAGMIGTVCFVLILGMGVIWQAKRVFPVVAASGVPGTLPQSSPVTFAPLTFSTQYDREKFRAALDELAAIARMAEATVDQTGQLLSTRPLFRADQSADQLIARLRELNEAGSELDRRLLSAGPGSFSKDYPAYQVVIRSIVPPTLGPTWQEFKRALTVTVMAIEMLRDAEPHKNSPLYQRVEYMTNLALQDIYSKAVNQVRPPLADFEKRITSTIQGL